MDKMTDMHGTVAKLAGTILGAAPQIVSDAGYFAEMPHRPPRSVTVVNAHVESQRAFRWLNDYLMKHSHTQKPRNGCQPVTQDNSHA